MATVEATPWQREASIATEKQPAHVLIWSRVIALKPSAPVAILLVLPLLLLLLDRNWPYATLVHDPWVYLGHALDPWHMLVKFNGDYHSRFYYTSRLGIILPLATAHALLPALIANFLVRFVLFEVSVLCVFDLLARTVGRKTGLLTALILGTNFFFLDAIARDYSDAFGIAYLLAAIWGASYAGGSWRGLLAMAVAGASTVALISVNLTYLTLAPVPLACYAMTHAPNRGRAGIVVDLAALVVGAIALFICFSLFYRAATGDFWFLGPSIAFVRAQSRAFSRWTYNGGTLYKFVGIAWIKSAVWLTLPVAVGLLSAIVLVNRGLRHRFEGVRRPVLWMVLYLSQIGVFLMLDCFTANSIFFQAWYYASMLIPLTILAMGALIGEVIESLGDRQFRVCLCLVAVFLVAQTAIPVAYKFPNTQIAFPLLFSLTPALLALVSLIIGSKKGKFRAAATVVVATGLLAVSTHLSRRGFREELSLPYYAFSVTSNQISDLLAPKRLRPFVERTHGYDRHRADFYLSIVDTLRYAKSFDTNNNLLFWFDMADPHAMIYDSVASCRNWVVSIVNFSFPGLNSDSMSTAMLGVAPGSLIAVMTVDSDAYRSGRDALASVGLGSQLAGQKQIKHGKIRFNVYMIRVIAKGAAS
jgi:hypothetical protein